MPARQTHFRALDVEMDPAVLETGRRIPGERGGGAVLRIVVEQDSRLDQHLKAVADAEDQFARRFEIAHRVGQVMANQIGKDSAGGDVVAEAESTRDAENLILTIETWLFEQAVDVQRVGASAGEREGVRSFSIAVGAGSTEDEDARLRHGRIVGVRSVRVQPLGCYGTLKRELQRTTSEAVLARLL